MQKHKAKSREWPKLDIDVCHLLSLLRHKLLTLFRQTAKSAASRCLRKPSKPGESRYHKQNWQKERFTIKYALDAKNLSWQIEKEKCVAVKSVRGYSKVNV